MPEDNKRGHAATDLRVGERVRITAGTFKGFEAVVNSVGSASGKVTAVLEIGFTLKIIELDGGTKWQRIIEEPAG